jgi:NTE family protein
MVWKEVLHSFGRSLNRAGASTGTRVGLALGGGFARGVAHIGVLRAFERANIPIHAISGVSAGSVVASCYASGRTPDEIEEIAAGMKFRDVARWTVDWLGVLDSHRMEPFLRKAMKTDRFENMRIPLAVVASDIHTGAPAVFKRYGDAVAPVRASCSYPGLFKPVQLGDRMLVDGMVSMEVPAKPLFDMGATHVVSVYLPADDECVDPLNLVAVVNRCFQLMSARMESEWRRYSDAVIVPRVGNIGWDSFDHVKLGIASGQTAAEAVIPEIQAWFPVAKVK